MNAPRAPMSPSLPIRGISDTTMPLDEGVHAYRAHFSCRYIGKVQAKSKRRITWYVVFSLCKSLPLHVITLLSYFGVILCVGSASLWSTEEEILMGGSRVTMSEPVTHANAIVRQTQARRLHLRKSLSLHVNILFTHFGVMLCVRCFIVERQRRGDPHGRLLPRTQCFAFFS
jgi:hypothetical protein